MLSKLIVLLSSLFLISSIACGQQTYKDVYGDDGRFLGKISTDRDDFFNCQEDSDNPGCKGKDVSPRVCMTYDNECLIPIACRLTVSALLAEPFTGFTKKVTDIRDEIVFFNQTHEICFNFGKDRYNAWFLVDTSEPDIDCRELSHTKL